VYKETNISLSLSLSLYIYIYIDNIMNIGEKRNVRNIRECNGNKGCGCIYIYIYIYMYVYIIYIYIYIYICVCVCGERGRESIGIIANRFSWIQGVLGILGI